MPSFVMEPDYAEREEAFRYYLNFGGYPALVNPDLAREAGVTASTAQKFINYLDMSYQTIQLQPWTRNKVRRLIKSPKLHYLDPGVQRAIIQQRGDQSCNEFESAVVAEIYKQAKNLSYPVSFVRSCYRALAAEVFFDRRNEVKVVAKTGNPAILYRAPALKKK